MDEVDSDSDCNSSDSGLETGASNLESSTLLQDTDFNSMQDEDCIYENAGLISSLERSPGSTKPLEKYEFGKSNRGSLSSDESVDFQDIDSMSTSSETRRVWGVRGGGTSPQTPSPRTVNPTEDKIAREIKELKEREDELKILREKTERLELSPEKELAPSPSKSPSLKNPASHSITQPHEVKDGGNSGKFNPSLYRPVVLQSRPRIMQEFIVNGGKVTAFTQPDNSVIQLRKPKVHKTKPKVSPPVSGARHKPKTALDKIQEELLETRKREDELKTLRKHMFRSQPDLSRCVVDSEGDTTVDGEDEQEEEEDLGGDLEREEEGNNQCPPSLVHTRGKSGLISVWENRIQCEKAA